MNFYYECSILSSYLLVTIYLTWSVRFFATTFVWRPADVNVDVLVLSGRVGWLFGGKSAADEIFFVCSYEDLDDFCPKNSIE